MTLLFPLFRFYNIGNCVIHKITDLLSLLYPDFDYAVVHFISDIDLWHLWCPPCRDVVDTTDTIYKMVIAYKGFVCR